jgi:hypothetical protein
MHSIGLPVNSKESIRDIIREKYIAAEDEERKKYNEKSSKRYSPHLAYYDYEHLSNSPALTLGHEYF